jgi:hypothetical protein
MMRYVSDNSWKCLRRSSLKERPFSCGLLSDADFALLTSRWHLHRRVESKTRPAAEDATGDRS